MEQYVIKIYKDGDWKVVSFPPNHEDAQKVCQNFIRQGYEARIFIK